MYDAASLTQLEQHFKSIEIPTGKIRTKQGEVSFDLNLTISTAISVLKRDPANKSLAGHFERLYTIKSILEDPEKLAIAKLG